MPHRHSSAWALLAGFALLVCFSQSPAEDRATLEGKVQVGRHAIKMEANRVYVFRIEAKGFTPSLSGDVYALVQKARDGHFEARYYPTQSKTYRLVIGANLFQKVDEGQLEYKLTYRSAALARAIVQEQGELKADDPPYAARGMPVRGPHKGYKVKLEAGRLYLLDMTSTKLDPFLVVEGPDGKVVAQDDDGGGGLNARLFFRPAVAGEYRVIATTYLKTHLGTFTVTVRPAEQ